MNNKNVISDVVLAGIIGVGVWTVFYLINNSTDPQSYNDYWNIGYPIILFSALFVSITKETSPILYGLIIICIQVAMGILFSVGDLNQLPLGLALHFVMLFPVIMCGYCGKWFRKKFNTDKSEDKLVGHKSGQICISGNKRKI